MQHDNRRNGEKSIKLKKTETIVQHNSATTHTHKGQLLHTAVGANCACNSARAGVADVILALENNADERWT
jgi:hypothetical protein